MPSLSFTLYGRSYCHLCQEMLEALHNVYASAETVAKYGPCVVEQIDVDTDAQLLALYDELVPVLLGNKEGAISVQLCHYFMDEDKVHAFLSVA